MEEMRSITSTRSRDTLASMVGERVRVKANMGRTRVVERMGTIKAVHPSVFVVESHGAPWPHLAPVLPVCRCADRHVELFDIESGQHIFTPLGNQLEEH